MLHAILLWYNINLPWEIKIFPIDHQDKKFIENIIINNPGITTVGNAGNKRTVDFVALEIMRIIEYTHTIISIDRSFQNDTYMWYIYYKDK